MALRVLSSLLTASGHPETRALRVRAPGCVASAASSPDGGKQTRQFSTMREAEGVENMPFSWLNHSHRTAVAAEACGRGKFAPQRIAALTEIHGPFHDIVGKRRLKDLFDAMGPDIDGVKFAGAAVTTMQRRGVVDMVGVAHEHGAWAALAGGVELAWEQGDSAVQRYLAEAKELTFNAVEFGCCRFSDDQAAELVQRVAEAGLKARPKVGTRESVELGMAEVGRVMLSAAMALDPDWVIHKAERCAAAGADLVVVNGEDLMEVAAWDRAAIEALVNAVGMHRLLFEAPHPEVFEWLVSAFGPGVNLSVDDKRLLQLQQLRAAGAGAPRAASHARDRDDCSYASAAQF